MKNWKILTLALSIGLPLLASAHLPRLVFNQINSEENPYIVEAPAISQAFYGEFKNNRSEYYKVNLDREQELYLSLLAPISAGAASDISAQVIKLNSPDSDIKLSLDGENFNWQIFREKYAGDTYLQGPSQYKVLPQGEYLITASSKNNVGKYVLTIGRTESFPPSEALKTLIALPQMKMQFFGGTFFSIFSGIVGKYVLAGIFAVILIILLLVLFFVKIFRKKPKVE